MADSATHIAAIADALDIHAFAVVGVSAGGGHALAAAALLPQRVSKCATIVGLGPAQAEGLDFYAGMPPHDQATWTRIANEGEKYLETVAYPEVLEFVTSLPSNTDLPQPDRDLLFEAFSEGLRPGPGGYVDDYTSTLAPWGFELSSVMCPTRVMVAKEDTLTRLHGLWIAEHVPAAEVIVVPGDHFGPREVEEEQLLGWLVDGS